MANEEAEEDLKEIFDKKLDEIIDFIGNIQGNLNKLEGNVFWCYPFF